MLTGKYFELYNALNKIIPAKRLVYDDLRMLAFGTDASFYRLIPKLVVVAENENEIKIILDESKKLNLPLTFRTAGTSLSGQAITDSILVLVSGWNKIKINEDGSKISLQPGVIGASANHYLSSYRKKIGPDPASINSCMIGGIAANNASGMCCGTSQNTYKTMDSIRIIFEDGTSLDTSINESKIDFITKKKTLIEKILSIKNKICSNKNLVEKINHKYKMKNTTGYSLNAFVDFEDPIEIISHLLIGSEGTLGFISEITYNTVPEYSDKATSLMLFNSMQTACNAVKILKECNVDAVELMDRASLRSIENKSGMPAILKSLSNTAAALLVETRADNNEKLSSNIYEIKNALSSLEKIESISFTTNQSEITELWNIRKGLFPSVGAIRATGTTCIIEDIVFPVSNLAEAVLELQDLFTKHKYFDAIIFGHALEGNLHFVFSQDFNLNDEINRYKNFMNDLAELVITKYDGAMKAEHGTGRNIAPFVNMEWGNEAYQLMKEIKAAFDPQNILNPGVILNNDEQIHLKNIKPIPETNMIIDKCIECGFCEVHCPSKNFTITPRHRIAVYREIKHLEKTQIDNNRLKNFTSAFNYFGDESCATDGLCAVGCPVGIDTGKLIKELRFNSHTAFANNAANLIANNFNTAAVLLKSFLNFIDAFHSAFGTKFMIDVSSFLNKLTQGIIPVWNKHLPKGADEIQINYSNKSSSLKVVYFPSCINRVMGISNAYDEKDSLAAKIIQVLNKAGYEIILPEKLSNLCCGMAFESKGFKNQAAKKANELEAALLKSANGGEIPILVDMSPCLFRMKETLSKKLKLYEPIEFILKFLIDKLEFKKMNETIVIHNTCSSIKMGLNNQFKMLAELCAEKVIVPYDIECCGWAGDKGFTLPELNSSALKKLKEKIPDDCRQGYSTSRTCEIGLSLNSGINYKSIIYLVDKCTVKK